MGQRTPLYDLHLALGAKMVDFGGWDMPLHYDSQVEEHHQVRRDCGVFDVSHMTVIDIRGAQAGVWLQHLLANDIRAGKLDFAVMAEPRSASRLRCQQLLIEELLFVGPASADMGPRQTHISFMDASVHEFILPSVGNGLRHTAEGHFRARSLPLNVKYEVDAIALITQCVQAGLGVSLLPGGCIRMDADQGRIRAMPFAEGHRTIVLCQAAEAALSPAAATVMAMVEEAARELVTGGQWLGARLA